MRDRDIVVIGLLVLLAMTKKVIAWGTGWVFPVAGPGVRLTQEFKPVTHLGVDIVGPAGAHIVAARSGKVWSTGETARGLNVVIDHGKPWATFYQHLSRVDVVKGQVVIAGQSIGIIGADPTDHQHVRHLHFAMWYEGAGDNASVDPTHEMASWRRI